ncbi:family 43 glycosylhydrolase [Antarcticibacterium sp. 1MA-6-2]|uniref:family 43 glycosylhydrolase n=1 Tax=Antarcticibacterium sp. 1MA-6-2 TaxID=2908210 RepID=UPI002882DF27|nr:family 43 glycosylhydrolase [Antarcticibacterium sp. 1MA-6-2]
MYSANDFRNPDYAVGYATSKSPLGPWRKANNGPIISRSFMGENGPGHGDLFRNSKNELLYVFHTHYSGSEVHPRKTAITKLIFEDSGAVPVLKMDRGSFKL